MYSVTELTRPTGNIYASTTVIGLRANQLLAQEYAEFQEELEKHVAPLEEEDETFLLPLAPPVNTSQVEFAKGYEARKKPVMRAMDEFVHDKLMWVSRTPSS